MLPTAMDTSEYSDGQLKYYVRTTGSDLTGNGTNSAPWLTIKKALATVPSGAIVMIGDGTYAEDSGSGNLSLNRQFTDWVTFQAEQGAAGAVTITTTSGTLGTIVNTATAYIRFNYITFTSIAGTANAFRINASTNHLDFQNCTFTPVDNATAGIFIYDPGAWNVSNITFTDCIINKPANGADEKAISFNFAGSGTSSAITFTRCSIQAISNTIWLAGCNKIAFYSCTIDSATGMAISTGGASSDTITFTNCTVTAALQALYVNGGTNWTLSGDLTLRAEAYIASTLAWTQPRAVF
jgi:hypothetical protein